MPASSLLALIDDIASVLDDVSVMTKVAAKKTAGVLGDDLALNAQQVSGVHADRELPVVWAVAKGSATNKAILVPAALAISAIVPWLVTPLLMAGGAYLCYEGFEKLAHRFLHSKNEDDSHHDALIEALNDPALDLVAFEKERIKGAIRTDFILSAEIITIALGTVATAEFGLQVGVLIGVAVLMTVGVYGLVAGIVKLDDAGLYLSRVTGDGLLSGIQRHLGRGILGLAPKLMKSLSVVGTAAMFMVGGGILIHGFHILHGAQHAISQVVALMPFVGALVEMLVPVLFSLVVGILTGAIVLVLVSLGGRFWNILRPSVENS